MDHQLLVTPLAQCPNGKGPLRPLPLFSGLIRAPPAAVARGSSGAPPPRLHKWVRMWQSLVKSVEMMTAVRSCQIETQTICGAFRTGVDRYQAHVAGRKLKTNRIPAAKRPQRRPGPILRRFFRRIRRARGAIDFSGRSAPGVGDTTCSILLFRWWRRIHKQWASTTLLSFYHP